MHQSGHSRAHSIHDVQFSSTSPMTPRLRGGRSGLTSGYCSVIDLRSICRSVTARPLASPVPGMRATVQHHDALRATRECDDAPWRLSTISTTRFTAFSTARHTPYRIRILPL